jgi:hypothetical protein
MTAFSARPRRALAVLCAALAPLVARAEPRCPRFDTVADTSSSEIAARDVVNGWSRKALGERYQEGAPCFVFVALISANAATAAYVSLRTTSEGDQVVLAETQTVLTGTKEFRRRGIAKAIAEFVAEKTARSP